MKSTDQLPVDINELEMLVWTIIHLHSALYINLLPSANILSLTT